MSFLNHLGQAAAAILLLELVVVLIILVAVSGGLAFGLWWVGRKTGWAFAKANTYVTIGIRFVHKGTDLAAKPVIAGAGFAETVKGIFNAIQREVQERMSPNGKVDSAPVEVAAVPAQPAEEPEAPVPLV
jgi:hypothetical protein